MDSSKVMVASGKEVVIQQDDPELSRPILAAEYGAGPRGRPSEELPEAVSYSRTEKEVRAQYGQDSSLTSVHESALAQSRLLDEKHSFSTCRKRVYIWILVVIILILIIVGAVVGGVVGTQLAKKNSSSASVSTSTSTSASTDLSTSTSTSALTSASTSTSVPVQLNTRQNTGLALTIDEQSSSRFAYQQLGNGSVVEIPYRNSNWSLDAATIVTNSAIGGTPLAATLFNLSNTTYRLLTFVDTNHHVMITNTTGAGDWTTPLEIASGDTADTSSPALALCADTNILNGIRLYYASDSKYIQELSYGFNTSTWTKQRALSNAIPTAGVACTITQGVEHLYYRNYTSIQQWRKDYTDATPHWTSSRGSSKDHPIEPTSDIAVTTNGAGTDYIFYRSSTPADSFWRASFDGTSQYFTAYLNLTSIPAGSMFAAATLNAGAASDVLLLSQPVGAKAIAWTLSSADGSSWSNGTLD